MLIKTFIEIMEILMNFYFVLHINSRNVISTWSSGTGGAGIFGSFSYAALISIGVSPVNTMLLMLSIPLLEGAAFWILLRDPDTIPIKEVQFQFDSPSEDQESAVVIKATKLSLGDKIRYLPSLLKFMIPLSLVFLFEYFINQGLVSTLTRCLFSIKLINFPFLVGIGIFQRYLD